MKTGHIHRVRTQLLNVFFENTGSGTVDQESITVSGTAVVLFKSRRRLAFADVVIKRSLQDQEEREGKFLMTVALQANDDMEAPTTTVAPMGTAESSATTGAPKTTAETSTTVTSAVPTTSHGSVRVTMRVENMEHSLLLASPSLLSQFVEKVEHVVAKHAGNGVSHKDVEVGLSPGSIQVEASVHAYSGLEMKTIHQALSTSTNIKTDLVQSLQSILGIDLVSTGPIAVSNFQAVLQSATMPSNQILQSATIPSNQTRKSNESDEFNWVLFALVPGATLACVLFLVCCVTWSRKVKKQNRKDKDRRQLAASNDEESQTQKQEDCKLHMANAKIVADVAPTEIDLTFNESTSFNVLPDLEAIIADRNRALPKLPTFARDSIDHADEKCFDMPQANFEDAITPRRS
jgi:hypothetical protein